MTTYRITPAGIPAGQAQSALRADLLALLGRFNRSGDGAVVAPSDYLQAVVAKR